MSLFNNIGWPQVLAILLVLLLLAVLWRVYRAFRTREVRFGARWARDVHAPLTVDDYVRHVPPPSKRPLCAIPGYAPPVGGRFHTPNAAYLLCSAPTDVGVHQHVPHCRVVMARAAGPGRKPVTLEWHIPDEVVCLTPRTWALCLQSVSPRKENAHEESAA